MKCTIHQPQYLPWLGYFNKADMADIFILLDDVQFKKNDWQNRNRIRTSQGWQWVTVPIIHNHGQLINEVKINNTQNWRNTHLNAVKSNYGKAEYFNDYFPFFEETYAKEWDLLVDINMVFIEKVIEWLGIKTKIVKSSDYTTEGQSTERLIELCQYLDATAYIAGADGKNYMDVDQFEKSGIELIIQDYNHPEYKQLWTADKNENFISHLSIIDLLFNHGPDGLKVLNNH